MRPPSGWESCGDGCLQLVRDWSSDDSYTFGDVVGAARNGIRYIGYKRFLAPAGPYETQVVKLPENSVVFDAIQPHQIGPWVLDIKAVSDIRHIVEVFDTLNDGTAKHHSLIYTLDGPNAVPHLSYDEVVSWMPYEWTVSANLWALTVQPPYSWAWHGVEPSNQLQPGNSGSGVFFGPQAVGSNVFYSVWQGSTASDVMVFDPVGGNRKLITFPSKKVGGACCLLTDGTEMTWLQGADLTSGESYATENLMASPFATSTEALKPRVVRPAFQHDVYTGGGVMGGGYALHTEALTGDNSRVILTRLVDGYYWIIAPRPGRDWVDTLYVDGEELALLEARTPPPKITGYWTIVRRAIASLGPPRAPGSGFDP